MDADERRFAALDFLFDYSKGTLWWVDNRLWNEAIAGFVWKRGSKSHPGLSICRRKAEGIYDTIPMLIGTSKKSFNTRALAVCHIDEESSSHYDKPTYFSPLRPCRLRFNDFGKADGVSRNEPKPRLDNDEMQRLNNILKGEEV